MRENVPGAFDVLAAATAACNVDVTPLRHGCRHRRAARDATVARDMWSRLCWGAVLAAIVGCSSHEPASPTHQLAGELPPEPTTFFTPTVTGVLRGSSQDFPLVSYVSSLLPSPPTCWTKLRAAIDVGYQLQLPSNGSYFIFEGTLPRDEVERCLPAALAKALPVRIDHDGELLVVDAGKAGTVYAAWRGSVIIVGSRAKVVNALNANAPDVARAWQDRLAALPSAPLASWSSDALLTGLFGVPTASYEFVIDQVPSLAGRVIAQYANAHDAAVAAARIREGAVDSALAPPELGEAIKHMSVTQTAATVTCEFSEDTFAGLDLAMLQKWMNGAAARKASALNAKPPDAPASTCDFYQGGVHWQAPCDDAEFERLAAVLDAVRLD